MAGMEPAVSLLPKRKAGLIVIVGLAGVFLLLYVAGLIVTAFYD
jgi:hypothetical protein